MKANVQALLEKCIEDGIDIGYQRAYKHTENPTEVDFKLSIENAIMHEIYSWFLFDDKYYQYKEND